MRIFQIILVCLISSACSPRLVSLPDPTQIPPSSEIQRIPEATVTVEAEKLVSIALADLSSRLSIDPQEVHVVSTEPQLWTDAALGCPSPREVYAQQTLPGYRLILEVNGQIYIYHTDTTGTVILCQEDDLPSFPVTPGVIDDGEPWVPVD